MILMPFAAHAVCAPGKYLVDGECKTCKTGYYCPGDDTLVPCPADTVDWAAEYTDMGYIVYDVYKDTLWSATGEPVGNTSDCHSGVYITVDDGQFYIEPKFKDTRYIYNPFKRWYSASSGYYLSPYYSTSWRPWYYDVKPCTNAPDHAHYTGAGTPDAPDGSVIDANDCPWECDADYGNHGGECVPLCNLGVRYIRAENGLRLNLYPTPYSSPRLAVEYNGDVCYGVLAPGAARNTINVELSGKIYHAEN